MKVEELLARGVVVAAVGSLSLALAGCAQGPAPAPQEPVAEAHQRLTGVQCPSRWFAAECWDPARYGAVGDGVHDDTDAIETAIACAVTDEDYAKNYRRDLTTFTVCLNSGTYLLTSSLLIGGHTNPDGTLAIPAAGDITIRGRGPGHTKLLLAHGASALRSFNPDDGYCPPGTCDGTTAVPLTNVRFENFAIEVATGGEASGLDLTGFNDSSITNVSVTFDAPSFGVGVYMRGSTGFLSGQSPKGNRVENLSWSSPPGASAPSLAYGVLLDPGSPADLANGPINNRFSGGRLSGGNGGVRINAGYGNVFTAIETTNIGAGAPYGIDYDFGGGIGPCDGATYPNGCVTNNIVLGGFSNGGGSAVRYVGRFQTGSRQNAIHVGLVRGVGLLEHDQEQEANGDSGNRMLVGATQILSVAAPGTTVTPFLKLTTADPFAVSPASTHIRAERPSSAPNEPALIVPNQSGAIQVAP